MGGVKYCRNTKLLFSRHFKKVDKQLFIAVQIRDTNQLWNIWTETISKTSPTFIASCPQHEARHVRTLRNIGIINTTSSDVFKHCTIDATTGTTISSGRLQDITKLARQQTTLRTLVHDLSNYLKTNKSTHHDAANKQYESFMKHSGICNFPDKFMELEGRCFEPGYPLLFSLTLMQKHLAKPIDDHNKSTTNS